jgi:hypothetical protein
MLIPRGQWLISDRAPYRLVARGNASSSLEQTSRQRAFDRADVGLEVGDGSAGFRVVLMP